MDFLVPIHTILENTAAAVMGATLSGAVILAAKRSIELIEERKYSLSGEYRSSYDDLVDGESVVQRDIVKLKQRGLKITGEQYDKQNNRGWQLRGNIDRVSGHIHGFYKAKGHQDSGVGVFIFEQKNGGVLDGLWAGYDSQNKNIEHGKYKLLPHLNVRVREAQDEDMARILEIACHALGHDYLDVDDFQNTSSRYIYVSEYEGKIQGFALAECLEKDGFNDVIKGNPWRLSADVKQADRSGKIGVIKFVAIDPAFQKKGIGMKLVQESLAALKKAGMDLVVSIGWKTDYVHIEPILLANGFVKRSSFKEFWHKESVERGYDCPRCGNPCHCEAILFIKSL